MEKRKIKVDIMGRAFKLVSSEETEYILEIAKEIDNRMMAFRAENPKLSYDDVSILTSLNLCDELFKERIEAREKKASEEDIIRSQLVEYSKELSKAAGTIKKLERELERIKTESRENEERVKREYEAKEKEILDMLDSM